MRDPLYWILGGPDGHTPIGCNDSHVWAAMFEREERKVGQTQVGPYFVSTVFLGLDHNWSHSGPPVLFETMVFVHEGGNTAFDQWTARYYTWDEAAAGHEAIVYKVANQLEVPE